MTGRAACGTPPVVACGENRTRRSDHDVKFLREGREEDCITPRSLPTSHCLQPSSSPFSTSSYPSPCMRARARLVILFPPSSFSRLFLFRGYVTSYRYLIKGYPIIFFYRTLVSPLSAVRRAVAPRLIVPHSGIRRRERIARGTSRDIDPRAPVLSRSLAFSLSHTPFFSLRGIM